MFPVTIEYEQYYPEIVHYLVEKYGLGYGQKKNPMPIEDEIYLGSSFSSECGEGPVKYIYIDDTPTSIGILLYLANHTSTGMCAALNNVTDSNYYGIAHSYLYD